MAASSSSTGDVELRPYQRACLEAAKERNILAVLPTNSGKTLVAASLAAWYFAETPLRDRKKVLFLANTGPLVEQQAAVLAAHLGTTPWDSAEQDDEAQLRLRVAHGQQSSSERGEDGSPRDACSEGGMGADFWASAEVFVLTPGFLLPWLVHGFLRIEDVGLLLLDEAHHTQGNDPYSVLMRRFYARAAPGERPRLLGLTASPFKGRSRDAQALRNDLLELEDLLGCHVWTSTDCCPPEAVARWETFGAQAPSAVAQSFLEACEAVLVGAAAGGATAADATLAGKAMRRLRAIVAGEPPYCQPMGAWAGTEALRILREASGAAAADATSRCRDWLSEDGEQDGGTLATSEGVGKETEVAEKAWKERCGKLLRAFETWEQAHRAGHGPGALEEEVSQDLKTLLSLLRARNGAELRALVFVQTRLRATLVHRFLEKDPELRGRTAPMVSAGSRSAALRPGMSVKDQRVALDGFRGRGEPGSESLRVLVSTSVLEEGIDVPNCSVVVRFDPPQTPLENIQSRGRARHEGSEYIHIVAEGSAEGGSWHRELLMEFDAHEAALRALLESPDFSGASRPRSRPQLVEENPDEVFVVQSTGAAVPMELAVDFVAKVYVHYDRGLDDCIDFAEQAFRTKERQGQPSNYQTSQLSSSRWLCELRLPRVGACSVAMDSEVRIFGQELPKEEAKQSAALAGIRRLHELRVLNDHLFVEGREEYLALLRQAKTGKMVGIARRHRSDDQIAMRTKEELVRRLPVCLRAPAASAAPEGFVLHRLRVFSETEDLGLLLPAAVPGGPLPFVLMLPRDGPLQCVLSPTEARCHLAEDELSEVAHWTACVMEIACVQKVLASSAAPLVGGLRVPRLKHDWGGYQAVTADASTATAAGRERAWFAVVPLAPGGGIDWDFLRWGLSCMESASFQPLLPDGAGTSARARLLQGRLVLPRLPGREISLKDAVLSHPEPRRQRRLQVFGHAAASAEPASVQPDSSTAAADFVLEAALIHRGVENVVSAASGAPPSETEVLRLKPEQSELLPLTVSQLVLLKLLPGILWRIEHLAVLRELEMEWASSMPGGASLRRLAEATTHSVARAPIAELPAHGAVIDTRQCDYERLEFLGDAVLKCLAGTWAYATLPGAPEGVLSCESQRLQTNRFLRRCLLAEGWEKVMLARPFGPKQSLEALRKQVVSQKHEADVVEGLLGASVYRATQLENVRIGNKGSVDAATAFFARYLLPHCAVVLEGPRAANGLQRALPRMGSYAELLLSCPALSLGGAGGDVGEAHPQEEAAERALKYRFRDRRVLRWALVAKATLMPGSPSADGPVSEFQRLEFLGDAALQLLVSQYLVDGFPRLDEGELSDLRMALVCNRYLAKKLVRRFASDLEAGCPHCFFPPGLQGPVRAFATSLLEKHPSAEADFVVGRGEGFVASAYASTVVLAAEVVEGPKRVADLYEALVAAILIDCNGDLARVWDVIRQDFEVSPQAASRSLEQWREALRGLARGALGRGPSATVQPEAGRADEVRRAWPARHETELHAQQRREEEAAQAPAANALARLELSGAPQPRAASTGDEAGDDAGAAEAAGEPEPTGEDGAAASSAVMRPPVPAGARAGAAEPAGEPEPEPAGAAGVSSSSAAFAPPLQGGRRADRGEGSAGRAAREPARAAAAGAASAAAAAAELGRSCPEANPRNTLQEMLQKHWRKPLTEEELRFSAHRGVDGFHAVVSIILPAGDRRLDFPGAGHTRTAAEIAAAQAALASQEVQAAFAPGHGSGFEAVLCNVLRRSGEGGRFLVELGQEPEVRNARTAFEVPNKRRLKDIVADCPNLFEVTGEGHALVVKLRAGR